MRALCLHEAGKAAVVEAGGMDVLARCLADSNAEVQKEAAAACANLACDSSHYSRVVADHPQALQALAALLHSQGAGVQAAALAAIHNITCNSPASSSALAANGAVCGQVHALQHSTNWVQQMEIAAQLAMLAVHMPDARDAAVAAGTVATRQRLRDSTNAGVRNAAAEALEELGDGDSEGGGEEEPAAKHSRPGP